MGRRKGGEKEGRQEGREGWEGKNKKRKEMRGHGHGFYVQLTVPTITLLNVLHAPW